MEEEHVSVRYYREHTGGPDHWHQNKWWRQGDSAADGYATAEEAAAEPHPDFWVEQSRIVEVTTIITTTVVG